MASYLNVFLTCLAFSMLWVSRSDAVSCSGEQCTAKAASLLQRKSISTHLVQGQDVVAKKAAPDIPDVSSPDWQVVFTEAPGTANGPEFDNSSARLLNFPDWEAAVAGQSYEVRLQWPDGWVEFVPGDDNIFSQVADQNIAISNITTSSDFLPDLGQTGWFCHACVQGGIRWGDTCWAVLPLSDQNRRCGCSSGNATGTGIYYGGSKFQQRCHGRGGGFAGPKINKKKRGDLPSIGLTFSIRFLDTTATTTTPPSSVCGPCSVVFSEGYAPGYGDTQGPTDTMTTMNQWVPSYAPGISSLILSGQGCQLQVKTTDGVQSYIYTPGVYNCGTLPDGSPSPQTCLPTGNDNMLASIMTCQGTDVTTTTPQCTASLQNGDFELGSGPDGASYAGDGYFYKPIEDWSSTGNTVYISSGNGPWSGTAGVSGGYFVGLQQTGAQISQVVNCLTPGQQYTLTFYAATRNDYPVSTLQVAVDGLELFTKQFDYGPFVQYSVSFTAQFPSATIVFTNVSPDGDRTVFLDALNLSEGAVPTTTTTTQPCTASLQNGDFELGSGPDGASYAGDGYFYKPIQDWSSTGNTVYISSGNGPWSGTAGVSGGYFVGLQQTGAQISQVVSCLTPGQQYTLTFYAATRNDYPVSTLQVSVDGAPLFNQQFNYGPFSQYSVVFTAQSTSATIVFTNVSPGGDRTVFLDALNLSEGAVPTTTTTTQPCTASLQNGDFELGSGPDGASYAGDGYFYKPIQDWSSAGNTVYISSGNGPWSGTAGVSGGYFVGLQQTGAQISQVVSCLTPGQQYTLTFYAATRNDYPVSTLQVSVDGAPLFNKQFNYGPFSRYSVVFTAQSTSATILFTNVSPGGDRSVFLDALNLSEGAPATTTTTTQPCTASLQNGDLELGAGPDGASYAGDGYFYKPIEDWSSSGNTVYISSGNGPWSGTTGVSGGYFVGLQQTGAQISQVVNCLTPGQKYTLQFYTTTRNGYPVSSLQVTVDGKQLFSQQLAYGPFQAFGVSFVAQGPSATITFTNVSPGGDCTVFLDAMSLNQAGPILNPDFDLGSGPTGASYAGDGYFYKPIEDWSSSGGTVYISSGNGPWGGTAAVDGAYYVGLQNTGAQISQTIGPLVPGQSYTLSFYAATRNGYPVSSLTVTIDGPELFEQQFDYGPFQQYSVNFVARSTTADINFVNVSPGGDRTVFLDDISLA